MSCVDVAEAIIDHYQRTAGAGHTRTAREGTESGADPIVVTAFKTTGQDLYPQNDVVDLYDIEHKQALAGRRPLVLDHGAVTMLLADLMIEIGKQEAVLGELREFVDEVAPDPAGGPLRGTGEARAGSHEGSAGLRVGEVEMSDRLFLTISKGVSGASARPIIVSGDQDLIRAVGRLLVDIES